ncbi:MAG: 1-pyrroline-5-carboxylate dehydrogenase, partial [Mycetocola sp.]
NLYVNRGITGAIVRRQPFGGWKKSSVGAGTKAGGPNYLAGLSSWESRPSTATTDPVARMTNADRDLATLPDEGLAFVLRSLRSDEQAWQSEFGVARDVSGLGVERNVLRYLPVDAVIRATATSSDAEIVRVIAAAARAGSTPLLSVEGPVSAVVTEIARRARIDVSHENTSEWESRVRTGQLSRIRLIGDADGAAYSAIIAVSGARPDLAVYRSPVTEAGRLELLPFLHEQAVSITAHRFGTPNTLSEGIFSSEIN